MASAEGNAVVLAEYSGDHMLLKTALENWVRRTHAPVEPFRRQSTANTRESLLQVLASMRVNSQNVRAWVDSQVGVLCNTTCVAQCEGESEADVGDGARSLARPLQLEPGPSFPLVGSPSAHACLTALMHLTDAELVELCGFLKQRWGVEVDARRNQGLAPEDMYRVTLIQHL